jgi:hypothetical protein
MATDGAAIALLAAVAAAIAAAAVKQPIVASSPAVVEHAVAVAAQRAMAEQSVVAEAEQSALAARDPLQDTPHRPAVLLPRTQQFRMQVHRALPRAAADVPPAAVPVAVMLLVVDMAAANTSNPVSWNRGAAESAAGCATAAEQTSSAVFAFGQRAALIQEAA